MPVESEAGKGSTFTVELPAAPQGVAGLLVFGARPGPVAPASGSVT